MAETERAFAYVALRTGGERVRGRVSASSEAAAYERLKREGLAPLTLKISARAQEAAPATRVSLGDRRAAELFASLGLLLSAGADIRSALGMLSDRADSKGSAELCRALLEEVSGGAEMDGVLARYLPSRQSFVASLAAAAQASGDLGSGLTRAGELLAARAKLRDQLVSTLSYPVFVLISSISAVLVILLFVVPTLAPLVQQSGSQAPMTLQVLLWASQALSSKLTAFGVLIGASLGSAAVSWRLGLLAEPVDRALLDGPFRSMRCGLVFGAFSSVLGNMLAAGAPLSDALRLAVRTAPSALGRARLEAAAAEIRQGQLLSAGLAGVRGFPPAIVRLCAVGERSGSLGIMLSRAGRLEEEAAFRKLEAIGRLLGPVLIILLGALVGLLMAALLSGLGQVGQGIS